MSWEDDMKYEMEQHEPRGGQHVGVSPTGVWAIHEPSGMRAFCNTERSQHRNRTIAKEMIEYALINTGMMRGYEREDLTRQPQQKE